MPIDISIVLKNKGIPFQTVDTSNGLGEIRLNCPQCEREGNKYNDGKLYISTTRGLGICHRCQWTGNVWKILQLFQIRGNLFHTNKGPTPSLRTLKKRIRHEFRRTRQPAIQSAPTVLPSHCVPAWDHARARRYLRKRGFSRRRVERLGFKYCPRGYYKRRLVIPVFDEHSIPVGWVSRYIGTRTRDRAGRPIKKYLYAKGFRTSQFLYGVHTSKKERRNQFAILLEGAFDALHCQPYGLATFGTHVSQGQIDLLRNQGIQRVVIIWDHDSKKVARRNVRSALKRARRQLSQYFRVGIVWLPKRGTDPDDYSKEQLFQWARESLKIK